MPDTARKVGFSARKVDYSAEKYFFMAWPILLLGFGIIPALEFPSSDINYIEYWTESQNMHTGLGKQCMNCTV
jgi:hypothetical protein